MMIKYLPQILLAACIGLSSGCVVMNKNYATAVKTERTDGDIPVYTSEPALRTYQEITHYEAIGSNVTSFDRVLTRIRQQARRDGCQALVKVKFYRQPLGAGRHPSTFPKIEAVGIRFTDRADLANN